MKVGMIFECGPDGADKRVCEHLGRMIRPDVQFESVTLSNKPTMIAECGRAAAALFESGCQRVLIIWDLYPAWRTPKSRPCRKEDRENIRAALTTAGIGDKDVHLVCIEEELEAWLLADSRALVAILSKASHQAVVRNVRRPERQSKPKTYLTRIFQQNSGRPYSDLAHAERIVRALPDLNRIRGCPSFTQFEDRLKGMVARGPAR